MWRLSLRPMTWGPQKTCQMHFCDRDLSFAFMKQNFVIDNSLPPITKKNWPLTFLLLKKKKKTLYEIPPGSSCYTGKLLQLRFLKNWKTAGLWVILLKSMSTQLCMKNLEMIDGNIRKSCGPPKHICFFSKIRLAPKISRYNWKLTKLGNDVYL